MKNFLLSLIALSFFGISNASGSLQITKVVFNPAPQCATTADPAPTTTVSVTVAGGVLPYAFSSANPSVSPVVNALDPHTATFTFPVSSQGFATISVVDSSLPVKTGNVRINVAPQGLHNVTFIFSPPCNGKANGRITVSIDGQPAASGFELRTINTFRIAPPGSYAQFTDLLFTEYTVSALLPGACPGSVGGQAVINSLNEIDFTPVSSLEDYIQRAYCDGCFGPR